MTPINPLIYDFETPLESALVALAVQRPYFINNPKQQQGTGPLYTPRVEFKFVWNGWGPVEHYWINQTTAEKFLDYSSGTLYAKIVTRRAAKVAQNHGLTRGLVRWMLQDVKTISSLMPLHKIVKILEHGTVPDFKQDEYHDISALSFVVHMQIPPSSFANVTADRTDLRADQTTWTADQT